jgi:hypothetical protein
LFPWLIKHVHVQLKSNAMKKKKINEKKRVIYM